jgi:hypothetical protein
MSLHNPIMQMFIFGCAKDIYPFVKKGTGKHHVVGTKWAFILLLATGRYLGLCRFQIDVARMDVTAQSDQAKVENGKTIC